MFQSFRGKHPPLENILRLLAKLRNSAFSSWINSTKASEPYPKCRQELQSTWDVEVCFSRRYVTAWLSMVWLIPQHTHIRTCFRGWVLMWKGWISAAHWEFKTPRREVTVSMTSTQIEKAKQVTETFARIPDKEIILYKFHLRVSFKLYRKLNCFTAGQSIIFLSVAWI